MVAPKCSKKPGIVILSSNDGQVMTNAPLFIVTVGPAIAMDACPLVITILDCVSIMRGLVGLASGPAQMVIPPPGAPNTVIEFRPVV